MKALRRVGMVWVLVTVLVVLTACTDMPGVSGMWVGSDAEDEVVSTIVFYADETCDYYDHERLFFEDANAVRGTYNLRDDGITVAIPGMPVLHGEMDGEELVLRGEGVSMTLNYAFDVETGDFA